MPVSKRKIKQLLDEGAITSWDDPRLLTLSAMRKRGFEPKAIRSFVLSLGLTLAETKPPFKALESMNRKIIDPLSIRLFFVKHPIMLTVDGAKNMKVTLDNHPTNNLGTREVEVSTVFYISRDDANLLAEGEQVRLMELYNIKIDRIVVEPGKNKAIIASYLNNEIFRNMKKIQWVSDKSMTKYNILIPYELYQNNKFNPRSLESAEGLAEAFVLRLKPHALVQFIRFGFCITENNKSSAIFIHR
jgi:glutamyl-tRNA synthetase